MENANIMLNVRKEIPIFFATDDNYIPYLEVALRSLITNASKDYNYVVNIINSGLSQDRMDIVKRLENDKYFLIFS